MNYGLAILIVLIIVLIGTCCISEGHLGQKIMLASVLSLLAFYLATSSPSKIVTGGWGEGILPAWMFPGLSTAPLPPPIATDITPPVNLPPPPAMMPAVMPGALPAVMPGTLPPPPGYEPTKPRRAVPILKPKRPPPQLPGAVSSRVPPVIPPLPSVASSSVPPAIPPLPSKSARRQMPEVAREDITPVRLTAASQNYKQDDDLIEFGPETIESTPPADLAPWQEQIWKKKNPAVDAPFKEFRPGFRASFIDDRKLDGVNHRPTGLKFNTVNRYYQYMKYVADYDPETKEVFINDPELKFYYMMQGIDNRDFEQNLKLLAREQGLRPSDYWKKPVAGGNDDDDDDDEDAWAEEEEEYQAERERDWKQAEKKVQQQEKMSHIKPVTYVQDLGSLYLRDLFMLNGNYMKFAQQPALGQLLKSTQGELKYIGPEHWGSPVNQLGKILSKVRST